MVNVAKCGEKQSKTEDIEIKTRQRPFLSVLGLSLNLKSYSRNLVFRQLFGCKTQYKPM